MGPKAFRAGKATQMAAAGDNLSKDLDAGEWKRRAFLKYTDFNVINASGFLHDTLEDSDAED